MGASCFENNKKVRKGNITFDDIRRNCKMPKDVIDSWDNFNKHSSKTVHASPSATFGRLFNEKAVENNSLIVYHSIEGLWFPVKFALLFLQQATLEFTTTAMGVEVFKEYYSGSEEHKKLAIEIYKTTILIGEWMKIVDELLEKHS